MDALNAIRARRAEIARAIEALAIEDQELATTETVLARLTGGKSAPPQRPAKSRDATSEAKAPARPQSQRALVLETLARSDDAWLRSKDIISEIYKRWGERVPELSLRPLLTTLKNSRQVVRRGRFVALRERSAESRPGEVRR